MSDGISTSASLQSSVGTTSAEELAEKYQKLFLDYSRIKAQHSVLKKAVRKEQTANASLQEECKTKEQELRTSLQQLDLLNFHNERLTKRIQSLQDSGNSRLTSGWLLGSAKKELEKSKTTLTARTEELTQKIEENERLHKEIYEVNSLYTQHVNVLQANITELETKKKDLQMELERSYMASEEALSTMRVEKREAEAKLEKMKDELRLTNALMEKHEEKLKQDDDVHAELDALRQTLSINLGLADETQSEQFNALSEKIDSESNEIIESFRQLQFSTRDYLNALKENSDSSHELSVEVRNASKAWQKNLQTLAIKFTSAQNKISELAAEKDLLVKANENDSNKVAALEVEISRLKKELDKRKTTSTDFSAESSNDEHISNGLSNGIKGDDTIDPNESDDENDDDTFVYPVDNSMEENVERPVENKESTVQPIAKPLVDDDINNSAGNAGSFLAIDRDMSVRKDDEAKQRENLIKNHYELKITQLNEQLQLADSNALRFHKALDVLKSKLNDSESKRSRGEQEISKLKEELNHIKETLAEERNNHKRTVDQMTEWIDKISEEKRDLENRVESNINPGPSSISR